MESEPSAGERRVSTDFHLVFAPEQWSATQRLSAFVGPPFKVERDVAKGVRTTQGHLGKFRIIVELANKHAPTLQQDRAELDADGFTPAIRSKEYTALIETLICSLYSAIDGIRLAIYGAYKGISRVQRGSNGQLFDLASKKKYGPGFPETIRSALDDANRSWFPDIRRFRTELIHGEVGDCHLDSETKKIKYMHGALGTARRALVIDDICAELTRMYTSVFNLAEQVFGYLYSQLEPVTRQTICGIYQGRVYLRDVAPGPDLSFDSGICRSLQWFEKESGYECPLRSRCGAYSRAAAEIRPVVPDEPDLHTM